MTDGRTDIFIANAALNYVARPKKIETRMTSVAVMQLNLQLIWTRKFSIA